MMTHAGGLGELLRSLDASLGVETPSATCLVSSPRVGGVNAGSVLAGVDFPRAVYAVGRSQAPSREINATRHPRRGALLPDIHTSPTEIRLYVGVSAFDFAGCHMRVLAGCRSVCGKVGEAEGVLPLWRDPGGVVASYTDARVREVYIRMSVFVCVYYGDKRKD